MLVLTEEERAVLKWWSRRGRAAKSLALRSMIVLGCADGRSNNDVASQLGTSPQTVCKWRARFVAIALTS
jgi:FixJ family two-component response regulator